MDLKLNVGIFLLIFVKCDFIYGSEYCTSDKTHNSCEGDNLSKSTYKQKRYLLYDVNPGEGFNLRRDVYMRVATLVKKLNAESKNSEWILVLPPWGPLYHWKSHHIGHQMQIKWEQFFNTSSLASYIPIMELEDFLHEYGSKIDSIYYLQHYAEGWTNGVWEERSDVRKCIDSPPYKKNKSGKFVGWFWGFDDIFAVELKCLSIQGYSSTLKRFLASSNASVIMVDRAEVILHDAFGDSEYWQVRRSMVFSKKLTEIGDNYRKKYLNSTDLEDRTMKIDSLIKPIKRNAVGGPYVAVHLRRKDFVHARPKDVPSIAFAAQQISKHMKRLNIYTLFVATDAANSDVEELKHYIPGATRFIPSSGVLKDILDGGVAIVDQWICAHARFFLGTFESTFSFRIQEEREILGFPVETTFNRLCGNNETVCSQSSKWTIAF